MLQRLCIVSFGRNFKMEKDVISKLQTIYDDAGFGALLHNLLKIANKDDISQKDAQKALVCLWLAYALQPFSQYKRGKEKNKLSIV